MKYFSMFSGIGGFEYGMEQSKHNFECVGFCEVDKYAISIYTRHFPTHRNYGDATRIHTEDLPDFEFLVGGFPCQAFSIAGKRKGFNEARGTLFFEIARILRDKRPRYFLLENVKGLLSHNNGETFKTILEVLADLGYYVQWTVLNSKDFGVPQNRERIFIEGYLGRECGLEVLSIRGNCEEDTDRRQVSNTYYGVRNGRVHKEDEIRNTLSCQGHNGAGSQLIQLNNNKKRSQGSRIYDDNGLAVTLNAPGNNNWYKINKVGSTNGGQGGHTYDSNGLAPTLCGEGMAHNGGIKIIEKVQNIKKVGNIRPSGHSEGNIYDNEGISPTITRSNVYGGCIVRKLTPVECERLQGFPDNWTQYGKDDELISDTQRYKCCGNAVTTTVITAIVDEMFDEVKQ